MRRLQTVCSIVVLAVLVAAVASFAQQNDLPGPQKSISELLNADGSLNLGSGFSGSLDPAGFEMVTGPNGEPRFVPKNQATSGQASIAAVPDDANWDDQFFNNGVSNTVQALAVDGSGTLYAGGLFTIAGSGFANYIAQWDGSSWSALGSGMDGEVWALAVDGSGTLYAGGEFTTAGGISANYIAQWDGSNWSALGSGVDGTVRALAVDGVTLYAGGQFTTAGGGSANYIAQWDGSNWSALGSGMNNFVYALAVDGSGTLYAGGAFISAGGGSANRIAQWDGTNWAALGTGMNQPVLALAVDGSGTLYAGGQFTTADGSPANYIAQWDGSNWSALGSGMNNFVYALAVDGSGTLYAGGFLTTAGGSSANHIAQWDGSSWSALGTGMNSGIFTLAVDGSGSGTLYAGASFAIAGGVPANRIAQWDGLNWSALGFGPGINNVVRAFAVDGSGTLYAGGDFLTAGGVIANYIAQWDGSSWSALGSGMNGGVSALAVDGSTLYAGGSFTTAGGVSANYIAQWDGSNWSALGSGMDAAVLALAVDGSGTLYAGGNFTTAGGSSANRIAQWDGSNWSALGSGMNSFVYALAVDGGTLYAGGEFSSAGGVPASRIAQWDGSNWSTLGSGMDSRVFALAVDGSGTLYAGGFFTTAGGVSANYIAQWDGSSWSALGAGINTTVRALALDGSGMLYAGGFFTTAGAAPANYIAQWDGSSWSALGSGMNSGILALEVDGSTLYAGGSFTTAGEKPSLHIGAYQLQVSHSFIVTNTNDAGDGSLRQAILNANALANLDASTPDTIKFDIPGAGPHTISPSSELPSITDPVFIDGYTQPGAAPATASTDATIMVALDGSSSLAAGLAIAGGTGSTIKGLAIYGDFQFGIVIASPSSENSVEGNFFGTDPTGTIAVPSGTGVAISDSPNNTVGGATPASRNIIAAATTGGIIIPAGILIGDAGSTGNRVQGNFIGTDVTGTITDPDGTQSSGDEFGNYAGVVVVGAPGNQIGGAASGEGNLISGNSLGIYITNTTGNQVQGNLIGTDKSGTVTDPDGIPGNGDELGNRIAGVGVENAAGVLIGGADPGAGNVIAGNGLDEPLGGLFINATGTLVQGNFIGTDASGTISMPNFGNGVTLLDATGNTIGGTGTGEGNVIAYNQGIGVYHRESTNNSVLGNSIFNNGGLGIDIFPVGVNLNDIGDIDLGSNNLQNFPEITSATGTPGSLAIDGTLNSAVNTTFRVEFFASAVCNGDQSGVTQTDPYGEGERFLGAADVTTNGSGDASFSANLAVSVADGAFITATATDPSGNTSEFAMCTAATITGTKPYLIIAEENVKFDGTLLSDGDIHSNGDIAFHNDEKGTHTGNLSAVKDITIDKGVTIAGDATAKRIYEFGDITGTVTDKATVAEIPLPVLNFTAGGPDKTAPKKGSLTLAPGTYGKVKVEKKATLYLTSGDYFMDELDTDNFAKIVIVIDCGGPVNINVVKDLEIDDAVEIVIDPGGDSNSDLLTFSTMQKNKVDIGKYTKVLGNIIAPKAEVHFSDESQFRGTVCADKVTVEEGVPFLHHNSPQSLPKRVVPEDDDELASDEYIADSYQLQQNYPNPFNPTTVIRYQLPASAEVKLSIYNTAGQLVRTLVNGEMPAGSHAITWDATDNSGQRVASGVYLYVIRAGDPSSGSGQAFTSQKKLILMK